MKRFLVGLLMVLSVCTVTVPQLAYANDAVAAGCEAGWFTPNLAPVCILLAVVNWFLKLSAFFLFTMATLFETSIDYSLNIRDLLDQIPIVNLSWAIFRDLANLSFIFILLYASINIILGTNGYNVKAILTKVILVAVFINFSLFCTKITIDISNIVALQFYGKLVSNSKTKVDDGTSGLTHGLMSSLGLTTFFTTAGEKHSTEPQQVVANKSNADIIWRLILTAIMGIVFITVTAFVLGAAAIMFVIRSAILIFLMMLSPLAFAATIIPGYSGEFEKWKTTLFKQAFFAPVYMALFYTVIITLSKWSLGKGGDGLNIETLAANSSGTVEIVFSFTILTVLMLGCLMIAEKGGARGAGVASKWGNALAKMPLNFAKGRALGLGSNLSYRLANSGLLQSVAGTRTGRLLGAGIALRAASKGGSIHAKKIKENKDRILNTAKLIEDRDVRRGLFETDDQYKDRKKAVDEAAKKRVANILGVSEDGKESTTSFFGFSHAQRVARRQVIASKIKETQGKGKQKDAVLKERLRNLLYAKGHNPTDSSGKDIDPKDWDFEFDKAMHNTTGEAYRNSEGFKNKHGGSGMAKIVSDLKEAELDLYTTPETDKGAKEIARAKYEAALKRFDSAKDLVDELKTQLKIEEEKLGGKLDELVRTSKGK